MWHSSFSCRHPENHKKMTVSGAAERNERRVCQRVIWNLKGKSSYYVSVRVNVVSIMKRRLLRDYQFTTWDLYRLRSVHRHRCLFNTSAFQSAVVYNRLNGRLLNRGGRYYRSCWVQKYYQNRPTLTAIYLFVSHRNLFSCFPFGHARVLDTYKSQAKKKNAV